MENYKDEFEYKNETYQKIQGQSKKDSHKEQLLNQAIGIIIGLIVMFFLLPLLKDIPPIYASPIAVFVMFCFSYARGYGLRRLFNYIQRKG